MSLITFQDLPSTTTPINSTNLNNNFDELQNGIDAIRITNYTQKNGSNTNVTSGEVTSINSITLTPGIWLVIGFFGFSANTSGARRANISPTRGSTDVHFNVAPALSSVTRFRESIFLVVNNETTYYANVIQNSGSTLTCFCDFQYIKLSNINN